MNRLLLLTCVVGACAKAGPAEFGGRTDGSISVVDADTSHPQPDAFIPPMVDAPPGMMSKTLSETTTETLVQNTAPACGTSTATDVNNYYRVFDPATFGITTDFHITQVNFQVDFCTGQTVTVNVGTYNATPGTTLATASMTQVASNTSVTVPNTTTGAMVTAPFTTATIPAGKKLYVEIDSPAGQRFYMGANTDGETAPGYISASACSISVPTNISTISASYPKVHLLMTVTGTY